MLVLQEDLFNSPGKHIRGCRVLAGPFDWSIHAAVSAVKFARTQQHAVVMIDEPIQVLPSLILFEFCECHEYNASNNCNIVVLK